MFCFLIAFKASSRVCCTLYFPTPGVVLAVMMALSVKVFLLKRFIQFQLSALLWGFWLGVWPVRLSFIHGARFILLTGHGLIKIANFMFPSVLLVKRGKHLHLLGVKEGVEVDLGSLVLVDSQVLVLVVQFIKIFNFHINKIKKQEQYLNEDYFYGF